MPEAAVWLIIAAPLAAAVFNGLIIRPLFGPVSRIGFDATVWRNRHIVPAVDLGVVRRLDRPGGCPSLT